MPVPQINSIDPTKGKHNVENTVKVTGTDLTQDIRFGNHHAIVVDSTGLPKNITVKITLGAGEYRVLSKGPTGEKAKVASSVVNYLNEVIYTVVYVL